MKRTVRTALIKKESGNLGAFIAFKNLVFPSGGSWEDPTQEGDNLTILQAYGVTQNGDTIAIE